MGMEDNHLTPKEIEFVLKFEEPINKQLDEIGRELVKNGHSNKAAHLIAELCIYHFSLGRAFANGYRGGPDG